MSFSGTGNPKSPSKDYTIKHSDPIAINPSARRRTVSVSSSSPSSDSEVQTPSPTSANSSRSAFPSSNISNSPILSYFLSQSPGKSPAVGTFPFNRTLPVYEEDEQIPAATHARRASTSVANRFTQSPATSNIPEPQLERGSGLLRRLSLSSGAFKYDSPSNGTFVPPGPPNSAVIPGHESQAFSQSQAFSRHTKPRRAATINEGAKPRRSPSPMGERMLKGHFDGFN